MRISTYEIGDIVILNPINKFEDVEIDGSNDDYFIIIDVKVGNDNTMYRVVRFNPKKVDYMIYMEICEADIKGLANINFNDIAGVISKLLNSYCKAHKISELDMDMYLARGHSCNFKVSYGQEIPLWR